LAGVARALRRYEAISAARGGEGVRERRPAFGWVRPAGGGAWFGEGGREGAVVWAVAGEACWRVKAQLEGVKVGG
jgi:hypothetical protein